MAKLSTKASLADFQQLIKEIYSLADDRLYSTTDLLSNQGRFTMRALKGIRKGDKAKLTLNLLIALSWTMAVANRLHINVDEEVWKRFPYYCPYCGSSPCRCKKIKSQDLKKLPKVTKDSPSTIGGYQKMFDEIYPSSLRTLSEAGVHLAEETGELSEAVHHFLGEHTDTPFMNVQSELADYISNIFGVANSASINIADVLAKMYRNNCHECHKSPCVCNFHHIAEFNS